MDIENVACAALPPNGVQQEESSLPLGGVKQSMSDSQPLPPFSASPLIIDSALKRSSSERVSAQQGIGTPTDQSEAMSGDGGQACRRNEEGAAEEEGRGGELPPFQEAADSSRSRSGSRCWDLPTPHASSVTTREEQQQPVPVPVLVPSSQIAPPFSSSLPLPPPSFRLPLPSLPRLPPPFPFSPASRHGGIAAGSLSHPREREPGSLAGTANPAGIGGAIGPMMIPIRTATSLPSPPQTVLLNGAKRKWRSDINKREYDFCQLLGALQQEIVCAIAEKDAERSRHLAEKASRLVSARKRVIEIADGRGWSCSELFERYTLAELSENEEEKRRIVSEEEFVKRRSRVLPGRRRGGERKRAAIARPQTTERKRSKLI